MLTNIGTTCVRGMMRASVRNTSAQIAIPGIGSGHIDIRAQAELRSALRPDCVRSFVASVRKGTQPGLKVLDQRFAGALPGTEGSCTKTITRGSQAIYRRWIRVVGQVGCAEPWKRFKPGWRKTS
jgi:hypothetical protein